MKKRMTHVLLFVVALMLMLSPPVVQADNLNVCFLIVENSELSVRCETNPPPVIDFGEGYVMGIMASSSGLVNNQEMIEGVMNPDGKSFSIKGFTRVEFPPNTLTGKRLFFFLPLTPGTPIADGNDFEIAFEDGRKTSVHQRGYLTLVFGFRRTFRYAGNLGNLVNLDQEKLQAFDEGIQRVERIFSGKLVETVNVVGFNGISNIFTALQTPSVYIFLPALKESPSELKNSAEHEALHRFVLETGLSGNFHLKELFSDLRDFDLFSLERFKLIMTGYSPSVFEKDSNVFFKFINEKNFIKANGGAGHSQDNINEFCVSFLHSLLYLDRLEGNLSKLNSDDQKSVIATYTKVLGFIKWHVADCRNCASDTPASRQLLALVQAGQAEVQRIETKWNQLPVLVEAGEE